MVQYPLAWALLGVALSDGALWSIGLFPDRMGGAGGGRAGRGQRAGVVWRATETRSQPSERSGACILLPGLAFAAARCLSVAVMVASYGGRQVDWRGYGLHADTPPPFPNQPSGSDIRSPRWPIEENHATMMKTLFLHPPSFDGFDGGAGARYQAKREIKSFWFPTWLAQPAALVPGSKLIDAPPARHRPRHGHAPGAGYELCVMHTSTPSFASDVKVAEALKAANPSLKIGFVGAKVAVQPGESLARARHRLRRAQRVRLHDQGDRRGPRLGGGRWDLLPNKAGVIIHNKERATLEDMDQLPFVTEVYKRDLRIEDYFIGYLMHPYVSLYTGRGCKSHCTFCLWPQTVGGHRYRVRSPGHVAEEIRQAKAMFPQVREFFFDDDTFTDNLPRAEAIARELGKMGVTWSCNAKANVPRETLKVLKDNGLRLLLVGYESGNQQILYNIKKGMRIEVARQFTQDCHELGIKIHGTFILGLPGETKETIEETIRFATDINPHTIQVSLAAPYPGTFLYKQAVENGWLDADHAELVDDSGVQIAPLHYPHLSHTEIFDNVETFYKRFYFRAPKIASIVSEMVRSPQMMKRRLREGVEFFQFLRERHHAA